MTRTIARIIIPVFICIAGIVLAMLPRDLIVFPDASMTPFPFTDENDSPVAGTSRIVRFIRDPDRVTMTYALGIGSPYPYVGINLSRNNSVIDLRGYDFLNIRIRATGSTRLRLFILQRIDGLSRDDDYLSYLYLYREIPLRERKDLYRLRLRDFVVPQWWYDINNKSESDSGIESNFAKTVAFLIESESNFAVGVEDTIELERLSLSPDRMRTVPVVVIILAVYGAIVLLIAARRVYRKRTTARMRDAIIPYRKLDIERGPDPEATRVIEYLSEHFRSTGLSVATVSTSCSVPAYRIPALLKKRFQLSFPGYINSLRLAEAKRLLRETDTSITAIALDIGYNNISHFNNLFKFVEGMTPGDYRQKSRK